MNVDTDLYLFGFRKRQLHFQDCELALVVIEDDIFIDMNCLILKGVTIGRGSAVGASSVAIKDIPHGVVVAGNPARVIRENNS